ncbi:GDP-D-mannose pyrophosphorylase [Cardiosporidium cionae]|uniref:mannose-1-phosphate guanylyltransferase n=1 Tax=Cardiosporidium cionae TaxID=476202 RepID=A0ABQ7J5J8_9APIC|nr:GDP-D-mannose pyrophosphorylase [Cardiosporidium cionae]|eukprot:KAF8819268.1 GDP-D-mannose pyrophosphorylase [Cardiosporidium cionae]
MKALILVGGYGTRLRPLTLSVPKPLVHFCNTSIVEHQIAALSKVGVDHIVLALAHKPEDLVEALVEMEKKFGVRISCSKETEPLGTGGPIRLAEELLQEEDDPADSFFMLNSDVICDFPLFDLLQQHKSTKAEGTILITQVQDPSKFGVVIHDSAGKVLKFIEKPESFVGDYINAGIYLLRKSVISRVSLRKTSIETEIFPSIVRDDGLYCMKLNGYWADIGKPGDFLNGMSKFLMRTRERLDNDEKDEMIPKLASGPEFIGHVIVAESAKIGRGCSIGPNVTIDKDCVIDPGCRIKDTAIMAGVHIGSYSFISNSIVGWKSKLGKWVRVDGLSVMGEDVEILDQCYINGALILPHKTIRESIETSGSIII